MTGPGRPARRGLRRAGRLPLALALALGPVAGCGGHHAAADPPGSAARVRRAPAGPATAGPRRCTVTALLAPACGAWWGMYLPASTGGQGLPGAVRAEERAIGRPLDIIERYHDFSNGPNGVFPDAGEQRIARHHLLLFSWAPAIWTAGTFYQWRAVASGALDQSVIIPEAERLRAFHHTVFLSFSAEPDGATPREGTPAQFVAAWRHVHGVFARLGVRNVAWVWTTTGYVPAARTIAALYPGNAYVDWIGYDPYNFFNCHHNPWHSFAGTVEPFYRWLTAHHLGVGKPLMLAEFGSAADVADPDLEAAWYRGIVPVLRGLPRLKALVFWNSANPRCDLKLAAAPAGVQAAYRQAGLSPYLRQPLP